MTYYSRLLRTLLPLSSAVADAVGYPAGGDGLAARSFVVTRYSCPVIPDVSR